MRIERCPLCEPAELREAVKAKIESLTHAGSTVDYLTFVPDGEPTLDSNLSREIDILKESFDIKVAVITNASLLWIEDVRQALLRADLVSLKVDAVSNEVWRKINRPHAKLSISRILDGILSFPQNYSGSLITETMLVNGINGNESSLQEVARFLSSIRPQKAYIAIPTRPPAEGWVKPPAESTLTMAYQIFEESLPDVELLIGYEGKAFAYTGDVENDLLSIVSVHPMRKDAVEEFLKKASATWDTVTNLISRNEIVELEYQGNLFYLRNLHRLSTGSMD